MILPVKQTDIYGGLAEVTGLIRKQESMLVLEYQVKDDVFGMFNSNIRTLELPFHQIDSIEVKKRWFSARFEIYLNRLPAIKKPLHLNENCLSFDIKLHYPRWIIKQKNYDIECLKNAATDGHLFLYIQ